MNTLREEIIIPNKLSIYEKNTKMYKLIKNEHNRNYNAFKIDQAIFDTIFEDYNDFANSISNHTKDILTETLKFQWNSFCNYICNFY